MSDSLSAREHGAEPQTRSLALPDGRRVGLVDGGDPSGYPVIGLLVGAGIGLINGALVAFAKVPALVITLGTLYVYRGIMMSWAGSDRINSRM